MKENTYTYTARSVTNPNQILTFTLHDDRMSVDLAVPLEQAQARLDEESGVGPLDMMSSWLAPGALSLVQWSTEREPFHVADVDVSTENGGLGVTAWLRAAGLRLAPVAFYWKEVDNPDAAAAFVQEVRQRQEEAERPGKLPGPLDFWASWVIGGVGVAALAVSAVLWFKSRNGDA